MTARLKRFAGTLAGLGALLLVFGVFWSLVQGKVALVGEITVALGVLAMAGAVALEPGRAWSALTGRTARQGGNATAVTLAVLGILVLGNFVAARHSRRFDLTAERQFSLSPQSLQVLSGLEQPVKITAFMTPQYYAQQDVKDLLKEYTLHSDKLQVEYIDPQQKPAQARQAGILQDGTLVLACGGRTQLETGSDEQALTSALVKVARSEARKVYFLTGHGERDPESSDQLGYQTIGQSLERDSYEVATLNLASQTSVPDDAAAVVIAAPSIAPTAAEYGALNAYLDRGGSLLILADPDSQVGFGEILERWGLSLRQDVVIDPTSSFFGDAGTPLVSRFPYHTITKSLGGMTTFFPLAGSIAQAEQPPAGALVSPLVRTSADSWGETDRANSQARLDAGKDTPGPLDLAVAATLDLPAASDSAGSSAGTQTKSARLVLCGDADLVANDVLQATGGSFGNADLFLNAVSWLAEEESLISIRATPPTTRMVYLTPPQVRIVMYTSVLFLPALVVVAGVWVWWRRR